MMTTSSRLMSFLLRRQREYAVYVNYVMFTELVKRVVADARHVQITSCHLIVVMMCQRMSEVCHTRWNH